MSSERYLAEHFLEEPPPPAALSRVPPAAREVTVAKVRVKNMFRRGGRHPSHFPSKDRFGVDLEVTDVLTGNAAVGAVYENVAFGIPGRGRLYKYPATPEARAKPYFVIMYLDEDGKRRLVDFPIDRATYDAWSEERLRYLVERDRPGVKE